MDGLVYVAVIRWLRRGLALLSLILALAVQVQPASGTVTLAFLGDIMLGRGVAQAHPGGDWENALSGLAPSLSLADLALANLESPLTDAPLQVPAYDLRAKPAASRALSAAGLDLLSVVNNHARDSGARGVNDTRAALLAAGLTPIGPGLVPIWRTLNGLPVAFLALEDIAAPLDLKAAAKAVSDTRAAGGLVVVSIHWGSEYRAGPTPRQRAIAQGLADAGAAIIWGHHPHVLEPLAWVQGVGQPYPTLVAYSLGNALFDQAAPPDARRGALLLVVLDKNGAQSVRPVPFEIDVQHGRVRLGDRAAAAAVLTRLGAIARQFALEGSSAVCAIRCNMTGLSKWDNKACKNFLARAPAG